MQILSNLLFWWSSIFLLALSFYIIFKPTGIFHLSHAFSITLPAYCVYFLLGHHLPIPLALGLALISAVAFGILNELLFYRLLRDTKDAGLKMLVLSLGVYVLCQNLLSAFFGDEIKPLSAELFSGKYSFSDIFYTRIQLVGLFTAAMVFGFTLFLWRRTRLGKAIRAISENPELSRIFGIPKEKIILLAFALGSAYAGIAGILIGFDTGITPTMGFSLLLYGIVAMIIGGTESLWGIAVGALILATAQTLAAYYMDTRWTDAVTYLILIAFLIFRPYGVSGAKIRKVEI
uniref:Branched-chain amino acid transport system permease protein n=1 Tax=Candidatus Kentrum sp. MB TaxID=2138164 RepID=A0A450XRF5_9GAMM|nr:MAG: branched-chain amino acid transport system permease protein [Candidatus Kentron sp. MB]VFK34837.1 MAG: branched-chain amino acid transport system permease protein [Candidatus Kentron sp. MB]VFK76974.1 MAG: branched-chain amino acid transport system permease protein [Candidatus Kentron sp. MB]